MWASLKINIKEVKITIEYTVIQMPSQCINLNGITGMLVDLLWYFSGGKRIKSIMVFQTKWLEWLASIVPSYVDKYADIEKYKSPPVCIITKWFSGTAKRTGMAVITIIPVRRVLENYLKISLSSVPVQQLCLVY